jgi:hypothetical protein
MNMGSLQEDPIKGRKEKRKKKAKKYRQDII